MYYTILDLSIAYKCKGIHILLWLQYKYSWLLPYSYHNYYVNLIKSGTVPQLQVTICERMDITKINTYFRYSAIFAEEAKLQTKFTIYMELRIAALSGYLI